MAYTLAVGVNLGVTNTGKTLKAILVDTAGVVVGSEVTTGFVEIGFGNYLWTYAAFPDGHRGGVKIYEGTLPTGLLAFVPINPEEAENVDVKTSTRLATSGYTAQTGDSYALIGAAGAGLTALGDARLANLDAAVSTRLATAGYTAPATTAQIADKFLGRTIEGGADGTRTVSQALQSLRNKVAVAAGTLTIYGADDVTPSWTAVVTTSASADPITVIDPS